MIKRRGLIASQFILILFFNSCVGRQIASTWDPEEVRQNKVILFVPGLYGTALADRKTKSRVFQTLGQGLWGSVPLALTGAELGIPGARELVPDGLLDQVTVLPLLYSVDAYGDSFDFLNQEFGARDRVIVFTYDWRADNNLGVRALSREIQKLREAGSRSIALVGHSLGAILIAFYLRYGEQELGTAVENWQGTENVDAAVMAGAPFHGSMAAFHDLLNGTSVGLSKTQLAAPSLGSFPSFYQFLPPVETQTYLDNKLYPVDVLELEHWKAWKAGLFSDMTGVSAEVATRREDYTRSCFKLGRQFSSLLNAPPARSSDRPIPALVITGYGEPTLAKALLDDANVWHFGAKTLLEDGDGLVTASSGKAPQAFVNNLKLEQIAFKIPHRGMYTQQALQTKVTDFLKTQGF